MKTALFTNFSEEEFVGSYDGKIKKFAPGQSLYMPDYLAKHFAKHLTNRELIKKGHERSTSPKFPDQELKFMELFNRAYTPDETKNESDDLINKKDSVDTAIEVANRNRKTGIGKQDPTQPQVVISPDFKDEGNDDESSFENKPVE